MENAARKVLWIGFTSRAADGQAEWDAVQIEVRDVEAVRGLLGDCLERKRDERVRERELSHKVLGMMMIVLCDIEYNSCARVYSSVESGKEAKDSKAYFS